MLRVATLAAAAAYAAAYDETMAKEYVAYSGAAYCCGLLGHGVDDWSCHACKELPATNATVFKDSDTNANGFVGYSATTDTVVVSFSGTDPLSISNWISDLDTVKVDYDACDGCKVHKGFYNAWKSVRDDVVGAVHMYLADHPSAWVAVTGHSLGAADAIHCALALQTEEGVSVGDLYTFGEPRVGNDEFAAYTAAQLPQVWRVTHGHDPVPHLPTESMKFRHEGTEVFYPTLLAPQGSDYTVCDGSGEDKHCSDKYLEDLDVLDHLSYVGFDFTTNYLDCKL